MLDNVSIPQGTKAEEKAMKKETRVSSPVYSFFPTEVEGFDSLAELALDMHLVLESFC